MNYTYIFHCDILLILLTIENEILTSPKDISQCKLKGIYILLKCVVVKNIVSIVKPTPSFPSTPTNH